MREWPSFSRLFKMPIFFCHVSYPRRVHDESRRTVHSADGCYIVKRTSDRFYIGASRAEASRLEVPSEDQWIGALYSIQTGRRTPPRDIRPKELRLVN